MAKLYNNLELEFAKIASHDPEMGLASEKVKEAIIGLAPVRTGNYTQSIKSRVVRTKRGVQDRVVYSDDDAALSIEYGYVNKSGNWVPGHFVFERVINAMK